MTERLDEWLKLAKGLNVYRCEDANIADFSSVLHTPSCFRVRKAHCNISTDCIETLEKILNHPAIKDEDVYIVDQDTIQLSVRFDLDVRITVDCKSGELCSDPYLEYVQDLDSLFGVLDGSPPSHVLPRHSIPVIRLMTLGS